MKYVLAVSGGVDSVVLLDLMSKTRHTLVVAHVDHGIREDSAADARFVQALAKKYQLPYVGTRFELGPSASEEKARDARYEFLNEQAKTFGATLMTAHHGGDAIETIALNLSRGTGWRGLAVMSGGKVVRPLLQMSKEQLIAHALKHRLEWVEDVTNSADTYTRNRLRKKINQMVDNGTRVRLMHLRAEQLSLRMSIEREITRFVPRVHSRHFLSQIDDSVAEELIGAYIASESGVSPTRPQRARALLAVKTAKPGAIHHVAKGIELHFTSRNLYVKVV